MSDQTPDTTQDVTDGNEPSMEDILASIRKIIADDDTDNIKFDAVGETVSEGSGEILKPILAKEGSAAKPSETLSLEAELLDDEADLAIDAMVEELGNEDSGLMAASDLQIGASAFAVNESADEAVLDLEIPFIEDEAVQEVPSASNAEEAAPPQSADMDDDLNAMLDNLIAGEDTLDLESELEIEPEPLAEMADGVEADELVDILEEETYEDTLSEDIEDDGEPLDFTATEVESDMDLVKSLMADLTEKPYSIDGELDAIPSETAHSEILEDELSISPDNAELDDAELQESLAALISDDDLVDDDSTDMMDEILNMTLYDEANLQESTIAAETETVKAPEVVDIAELDTSELDTSEFDLSELEIPLELEIPTPDRVDAGALSLQDIAEAAQSDATALEEGSDLAALGGGLALGAAGASALSLAKAHSPDVQADTVSALQEPDDIDSLLSRLDNIVETPDDADEVVGEFEDDLSDIALEDADDVADIETPNPDTLDTLNEETPQMPRAAKSETIIDEVTEVATAGAFASLNQAVEEKAVVAERGDRIGDLVMESLRPMLKEWLDENLKGIVERAVTKEVKRISAGK